MEHYRLCLKISVNNAVVFWKAVLRSFRLKD